MTAAADPLQDPAEGWDSPLQRPLDKPSAFYDSLGQANERIAQDARAAELLAAAANQLRIWRERSDRGLGPQRAEYIDELAPELEALAAVFEARPGSVRAPDRLARAVTVRVAIVRLLEQYSANATDDHRGQLLQFSTLLTHSLKCAEVLTEEVEQYAAAAYAAGVERDELLVRFDEVSGELAELRRRELASQ